MSKPASFVERLGAALDREYDLIAEMQTLAVRAHDHMAEMQDLVREFGEHTDRMQAMTTRFHQRQKTINGSGVPVANEMDFTKMPVVLQGGPAKRGED